MKKLVVLLVAGTMGLAACASPGLRRDCLERKKRVDRVAATAAEQLRPGWTTQEVRSALGEPDEIVTSRGVGEFDIWKYYIWADCKAHLGLIAPETDLFFFRGSLIKWTTYEPTYTH